MVLSFRSFLMMNEIVTNPIEKTSRAKWDTSPGKHDVWDKKKEKVISRLGRHKVTQQTITHPRLGLIDHHFQLRGPWLGYGKVSLTTTQHTDKPAVKGKKKPKPNDPNEHKEGLLQGVQKRIRGKVKAVDLYHHLITHHGLTLKGDNHSPGAQKTWHRLLQRPGITMHFGKRKLKPDLSFEQFQELYKGKKAWGNALKASKSKAE